ncbi:hypothetical protein [Endozoicomonas sp. SCSIO W0465]|uniref:hypothetical protein n=1 Tax=Endozoicomonas sp. SCSIO W0465 TaxID=2918516 RepID=UPI0020756116|nr:hypothetical protein [Endozoicomonas sp. SCSIO W0465]USE35433.1 hypothetical protein MJO57_25580 [Endozoicomonas sp. SCSIO W0465]
MSSILCVASSIAEACKIALDCVTNSVRRVFNRTVSALASVKTYLFGSSKARNQSAEPDGTYIRERSVDSVPQSAASIANSVPASDQPQQNEFTMAKFKALLTGLQAAEQKIDGLSTFLQELENQSIEQRVNVRQFVNTANDIKKLHRIVEDFERGAVTSPADAKPKITAVFKGMKEAVVLLEKDTLNALLDQKRIEKLDGLLIDIGNAKAIFDEL